MDKLPDSASGQLILDAILSEPRDIRKGLIIGAPISYVTEPKSIGRNSFQAVWLNLFVDCYT